MAALDCSFKSEYVKALFPISSDRRKICIGGKGIGGFGALKLGLNHPDLFGSIFSVSGLADLQWGMDNIKEKRKQFEAVFGGLQIPCGSADDLSYAALMLAQKEELPRLYIISNRSSFYEKSNRVFVDKKTKALFAWLNTA